MVKKMKRNAIETLIQWKEKDEESFFFLYGMRGCGKTWLANEFAQSFYSGSLYLCLEQQGVPKQKAEQFCSKMLEIEALQGKTCAKELSEQHFAAFLSEVFEVPETILGDFLIIIDEVTASDSVWRFIQCFLTVRLPLSILLISSKGLPKDASVPCSMRLMPLRFDEYLNAIGSAWYADIIQGHFRNGHHVPGIVHTELLGLFEDYLMTGGMPAAINEYLSTESMRNISEIHINQISRALYSFDCDFEEGTALRMRQVLQVIPQQLRKPNQKFQYRILRRGATYKIYQDAIQNLEDACLILPCRRTDGISTVQNTEKGIFKLFPADVGMFASITGIDPHETLDKTLLECYLVQTLYSNDFIPYFWESSAQAHVDFLLKEEKEKRMIPIELRLDKGSRNKSLGVFRKTFDIPFYYRISSKNFEYTGEYKQIPYYAAFCLSHEHSGTVKKQGNSNR